MAALLVAFGLAWNYRSLTADRPVAAWGAVLGATGVAVAFAPDRLYALVGDTSRMMGLAGVVLIFGAFALGRTAPFDRVRDAALAGGFVVAVTALVPHAGRAKGALGNADFLGVYLCVVVPLALARAVREPATRRWSIPLTVVLGAALVESNTRGAWVGAAVGCALVVGVRMSRRRQFLVATAALLLVLVAALAPVGRGTGRGRVDTWRVAAHVVAQRPVTGWGPEGFRGGFAQHMTADFVRSYGVRQLADRAHNRFLDVAASTGLLGLAADVALLAIIAATLWRARDEAALAAAGAGVAWLVAGLFLFDTFDVAVVVWLLVGAAVAPRAVTRPRSWFAPAMVALTAAVAAWGVVNLVADRRLQSSSGEPPAMQVAQLVDVARLRPRNLDAYLLAGTAARASHDRAALLRAHELLRGWDDGEVVLADARVLDALGDYDAAAATLERLTRRRPNDPRVWVVLSQVRTHQHRPFDAARAREQAAMLQP